jgi:hypothetical protein
MRLRVWTLVASCSTWCIAASHGVAAEQRFTAVWSDGTRTSGDEVLAWQSDDAKPTIGGRALFEAGDPIRWLCDNSIPTADVPDAYVEFVGGDRLPGRVVGYRRGTETVGRTLPPHLLVEPAVSVDLPDGPARSQLRVLAEHVRRIVWRRRSVDRFQPGTLFDLDGRRLSFRSLRWGQASVRLLLDDGASEVPWTRVAELHLPVADPWEAHFDRITVLCPSGAGRLLRLETSGGLIVTTSNERFQARSTGPTPSPDPNEWLHVVQGAWSLDPLYLRHRSVRLRQFYLPQELPLTWLEPVRNQPRPSLAPSRVGRIDRNVEGGPLASGGGEFAWGFGVHAHHELEFTLPACVRGFTTRVGLDQSAGRGGCARAKVLVMPSESEQSQMHYESPILIGSAQVCDSGMLPIAGATRLVLVADAVERDRPAGADPLDIRDTFNWLEPRLLLDPVALAAEIRRRLPSRMSAWHGWQVAGLDDPALGWTNLWQGDDMGHSFHLCIRPGPHFSLTRRLHVTPGRDCLVMALERGGVGAGPAAVEVRLDGQPAGRLDVPTRTIATIDPDPLAVYLHCERGRELTFELAPTVNDQHPWIDWRGLSMASRPAPLFRWFEDDPRFLANIPQGDAQAKLVRDDSYSGSDCLRLTIGQRSNANFPGLRLPVRYQPQLGEYRYLRFAWRKRGGGRIGLQLAHDGRFGPDVRPVDFAPAVELPDGRGTFRYDAGEGPPTLAGAMRVQTALPANQWQVVTRDLYADFGAFDLTGISLVAPDGDAAYFDHIYLARTRDDFQWIDRELSAERMAERLLRLRRYLPSETNDPRQARRIVEAFAPGFAPGDIGEAGLALVEEHLGRRAVLRTGPSTGERPSRMTAQVNVPWGRTTRFYLSVANSTGGDGRLLVKANGQVLADSVVGLTTAKNGWNDLVLDLSPYAGQKFGVALEIERFNQPGQLAATYWGRMEVLSE